MTINTPAVLDSPELRILQRSPGARRERRQKRLVIRVRAFEVRYFPVQVRRIEHSGSDLDPSSGRLIRVKRKGKSVRKLSVQSFSAAA